MSAPNATMPNLTYRCPHCGTAVTVESHQSDEMLTCPGPTCGKPFRAEVPSARPVEAALAGGALPAVAAPVVLTETELETVQLAPFRRFPLRWLVYVVVAAASVAGIVTGVVQAWPILTIFSAAVLALTAFRAVAWWLRTRSTLLRITTAKFILENGFLSKETVEVPRTDVVDLRVNQSMWGRLVNVGDILIQARNGTESNRVIRLLAVPDPEGVARLIRDS
jgi:hypothetical protein